MKEYHESVVQPTPHNENAPVYKSVNLISLFVGMIVMGAFIYDNHSVTISVLAGVSFYGAVAGALILAPHATAIVIAHMREVTTRRFNELPYKHAQKAQEALPGVQVVDHPRIAHRHTVDSLQLPVAPSFVPAVPRTSEVVKADAYNFVVQLFNTVDGRPLPQKITKNKGQIQHPSPTPEAIEYLMALGIVQKGEGKQLYYNKDEYDGFPTLRQAINAIRTGVSRPSSEEGKEQEEEHTSGAR